MSLPCQINSPEFLLPLEDLNIVVEIDAYKWNKHKYEIFIC